MLNIGLRGKTWILAATPRCLVRKVRGLRIRYGVVAFVDEGGCLDIQCIVEARIKV